MYCARLTGSAGAHLGLAPGLAVACCLFRYVPLKDCCRRAIASLLLGPAATRIQAPAASPLRRRRPTRLRPQRRPDPEAQAGQAVEQLRQGQGDGRVTARRRRSPSRRPGRSTRPAPRCLTPSKGPVVKEGQTVEVNYHGVNGRTGKTFDDSFSRGTAGRVQPGPGGSRLQQGPGRAEARAAGW